MTERRQQVQLEGVSVMVRVYTDNLLFISELENQTEGEPDFGRALDEIAMYQLELAIRGLFCSGEVSF